MKKVLKPEEKTMEKIVALCKNRGYVYPGSEIYGGLSNSWDYGKGYYDTFFARHPVLKLGLCYDFQLVPQVPTQPHDAVNRIRRAGGVQTRKQ